MTDDPRAGTLAPEQDIVDLSKLTRAFFDRKPDVSSPAQRVSFGTSGHRGSSLDTTFNEDHIVAITQAICRYRNSQGIDGPLYLGRDTHALSAPAFYVALEVLAANGVNTMIDAGGGYTPTPVISHAILRYNKGRSTGLADGIVITPSHTPPRMADSSTTHLPGDRRQHRSLAGLKSSPTSCSNDGYARSNGLERSGRRRRVSFPTIIWVNMSPIWIRSLT